MRRIIDRLEFGRLFQQFEHTAFRLETRDVYVEPEEQEPLRRWLAGEPETVDRGEVQWLEDIRRFKAEGKLFERVRVVTEPHVDYTRWLLDVSDSNVAAGEDIRYLPRDRGDELALPYMDYWLFDSKVAAIFRFADDGTFPAAELTDEPATLVKCNYWRDIAWHYAIKWEEYAAKFAGS